MISFSPCYVYAILYGALTYGDISISQYLCYLIRDCVRLLITFFGSLTNNLSRVIHLCSLRFLLLSWLLLSFFCCLRSLTDSQTTMKGWLSIKPCPKTSYPGVASSVLWYVLCTAKFVDANISDQGSSFSR